MREQFTKLVLEKVLTNLVVASWLRNFVFI